jgi:hypothetical protein
VLSKLSISVLREGFKRLTGSRKGYGDSVSRFDFLGVGLRERHF